MSSSLRIAEDKLQPAYQLQVYPNPASDFCFLQLDDMKPGAEVTLYTAAGQAVKTMRLSQGKHRLSLSGLANGAYYIVVKNGNEIMWKNISKQ